MNTECGSDSNHWLDILITGLLTQELVNKWFPHSHICRVHKCNSLNKTAQTTLINQTQAYCYQNQQVTKVSKYSCTDVPVSNTWLLHKDVSNSVNIHGKSILHLDSSNLKLPHPTFYFSLRLLIKSICKLTFS